MKRDLDGGVLIFGVLLGLALGGLTTLFTAPKSGRALRRQFRESVTETGHSLRSGIESVIPSDPLAESMAEGKAAARRRMVELGQGKVFQR